MIRQMFERVVVAAAILLSSESAAQPAENQQPQAVRCYERNVVVVGRASNQRFGFVRFPNTTRPTNALVERIQVERVIVGKVRHQSLTAYQIAHVSPRTDVPLLFVLAPSQVRKFAFEIVSDSWIGNGLPQVTGACVKEAGLPNHPIR